MESDCLGCNDGVFHQHGGECVNCGADCHQGQQFDLSDDVTESDVVFLCDSCFNDPEVNVGTVELHWHIINNTDFMELTNLARYEEPMAEHLEVKDAWIGEDGTLHAEIGAAQNDSQEEMSEQ